MPVTHALFICGLYPNIMLIPPQTKLRLFILLCSGCTRPLYGHGKMKTEGWSQKQLWWVIWESGPWILFRPSDLAQTQLHFLLMIDHPRPFWHYAWQVWQNLAYDEQLQRHGYLACVHVSSVAQWCSTLCSPMDIAGCQDPLSMGILQARILDWSMLCPSPGDRLNPGIEPTPLASSALTGGFFTNNPTWEALVTWYSMAILLYLPGLSHLQEAASQKECNSLLLAWPWSRTLGDCVRILPLGLVLKPHWNSFTHLLFKHN